MGEIIHVDFRPKPRLRNNPKFDRFIGDLHKNGLDYEDIKEVIQATIESDYYDTCDDDIKAIVDVWFQYGSNL